MERSNIVSRREWIAGVVFGASHLASAEVKIPLIESHVHLFSDDPTRFPYSNASYKPRPYPVEEFVRFAAEARIDHAVIVHPEPYQDDHRYLEYCLSREPSKGFFKATCLFDPIDPATPKRLQALVGKHPGRIVALRIHEMHERGTPSTTGAPIKDRDLRDPQMAITWRAAHELGLAIQMHFIPCYAPGIGDLAGRFGEMPVILDHLARPGQGTAAEYEEVLKLARFPRVFMKFSRTGVAAASKLGPPYSDAKPVVKRIYESFGADRIVWGELGNNMVGFQKARELLDGMLDFAPEPARTRILGATAQKLFGFA